MRLYRPVFIAIPCIIGAALFAWAQNPKSGLYEVSSKMTWQKSPFPPGMQDPRGSGSHSTEVCVSQDQIDKYNGPKPQAQGGSCHVDNIQKNAHGMTADLTCGAPMTGKGTVQTTWTDSGHSRSKVHFTGSMHMGPNIKEIEWTVESESTFKGPDCGSVKPIE